MLNKSGIFSEVAWARTDYAYYVHYVHRGNHRPAKHTDFICEILDRVEKGEITRLILTLPPRHSKSMTVSETFPSYFIGKNPDRKVIEVSYGDSLAKKFGRANRRKIEEYGQHLFGIRISPENASVTNWSIQGHSGGMVSAGIGGPITGEGADLLIVDDPIKNREQAESVTYREKIWDEWQNTLLTRLHPGARIIIIMTRWHEDDLVGRLLDTEGNQWTVVNFPAEAEGRDPLGRAVGDPLWPEHGYGSAWLAETKIRVGSRVWNGLFQQRPTPQEGSIIKRHWWRFWRYPNRDMPPVVVRDERGEYVNVEAVPLPIAFEEMAQSWDMAFKDTQESAYVVGQVWSRRGAEKFLMDQVRERLDFVETVSAVKALSAKWPHTYWKWVEDKANGPAVISVLRQTISGLIPIEPDGSKEARAYAVTPQIEAGNVYLPHPLIAPWVSTFIEECASFPNGKYNDQVDAMTQALNWWVQRERGNNDPTQDDACGALLPFAEYSDFDLLEFEHGGFTGL